MWKDRKGRKQMFRSNKLKYNFIRDTYERLEIIQTWTDIVARASRNAGEKQSKKKQEERRQKGREITKYI